jgi:hypothetical protein
MPAKFTLETLNNRPLNREALKHLLAAQQDHDPGLQPMYQLLLWALEEGGLKWPHREGLEEPYQLFLERVAGQRDQGEAYRYLVEDPKEGPRLQEGDLERLNSPKAAARLLLENFQVAMTDDESLAPSYPPETQPE